MPEYTIAEGAVAVHELLISYVRAGFTRKEAMELVKTSIAASTTPAKED